MLNADTTLTVTFDVKGVVTQVISIRKEGLSKEDLLEGLKQGTYETGLSDSQNAEAFEIIDAKTKEVVAKIEESDESLALTNFESEDV